MDKEWITPDCNLALALSISSMTFAIICIVKEAYIGLEQNTKSTIITSSIISVTNTIIGLLHMSDNKFVVVNEGRLDLDVNFTVGLALLIVTIVLILHTRISRKSEESYEES
jgi:chromate transport protein ChrA